MVQPNYFIKLGYATNSKIYDYLDDYSAKTKYKTFPCLVVSTTSLVVKTTTHIAAIVEDIFRSLLYLIQAPLQEDRSEYLSKSFKIIKNIPSELVYTASLPLDYIFFDLPICIGEPKFFIVIGVEWSELYKKHFTNNTLNENEYREEKGYVLGRADIGLRTWQHAEKNDGIIKEITDYSEEYGSRWVLKNLNKQRL